MHKKLEFDRQSLPSRTGTCSSDNQTVAAAVQITWGGYKYIVKTQNTMLDFFFVP